MTNNVHNFHGVDTSVAVRYDYDKCIGCNMCAKACSEYQKLGVLTVAPIRTPPFRHSISGKNHENTETTRVKMNDTNCIGCGQCITYCTAGAIQPANRCSEIMIAKQQGKTMIAVLAPSTRIGVSEAMGMPMGSSSEKQIISGLRQLGFDYVFDNQWGADQTTIEDAEEVLKAKAAGKTPVYTSCCAAWVNLVETKYPDVLPHLSTSRSPHGITCSCIKKFFSKDLGKRPDDLFVVGVMPCTAKKFEAAREQLTTENAPDCDISITSREVVELFKEQGMAFSLEKEAELKLSEKFDEPFGQFSGSAYIFGKTAGVTESVFRYVAAKLGKEFAKENMKQKLVFESQDKLQNIKIIDFQIGDLSLRAAVACGGAAVYELMEIHHAGKLEGVDLVEVMICPGGCVNGGGQPRLLKKQQIAQRTEGLDKHDQESAFKDCFSNQQLKNYIQEHLGDEHERHLALHTHFENRKMK